MACKDESPITSRWDPYSSVQGSDEKRKKKEVEKDMAAMGGRTVKIRHIRSPLPWDIPLWFSFLVHYRSSCITMNYWGTKLPFTKVSRFTITLSSWTKFLMKKIFEAIFQKWFLGMNYVRREYIRENYVEKKILENMLLCKPTLSNYFMDTLLQRIIWRALLCKGNILWIIWSKINIYFH